MEKQVREYLSSIGRKGGRSRSLKKVLAVRENGKKGGRLKGSKNVKRRKRRR